MKKLLLITATIILILNCNAQVDSMYFGQTPPGDVPVKFASGKISGYVHGTIAISPKGDEIYWAIKPSTERIMHSKFENGIWTNPDVADFVKDYLSNYNGSPAFTPDGKKLFFYSDRPEGKGSYDAWYVEKTDTGWCQPIYADEPYNSTDTDFTPILTNKGNAYNMRMNPVSHVTTPLCYKYSGGKFTDPSPMDVIPEYGPWWTLYVSPEEDYLIFASGDEADLYIRFKDNEGQWGNPISMGDKINTLEWERFPVVSPDGKYLFFTRGGSDISNLFWVSTAIIDDLRSEANKYFGQTPPGDMAVIFAPGIISLSNRGEYEILFSSDGSECYFSCIIKDTLKTYYTKRINNSWTDQKEASFSVNNYNFALTSISAEGKTIFLTKYNSTFSNGEILKVERTAEGWSEPQYLPAPINSSSDDGGYTETSDSVIYIDSDRNGKANIWRMRYMPDKTIVAENLGLIINSAPSNFSPCIAPDESYLIYTQSNGMYEHLYISFNKGNNEWTKPLNMDKSGAGINKHFQISPKLSPDGKYLFYSSHDPASGNNSDIYWVSTNIIDTLKKIAMATVSINQTFEQNVKLYPNPTSGQFKISFGSNPVEVARATIFNLQGRQVFSKTFQNTPSSTIDLTGYTAGIYVIRITANEFTYNEKLIIE